MLNLLLPMSNRDDDDGVPQLEFLQARLQLVGREGGKLDESVITSLMTWKSEDGLTVLEDEKVSHENYRMMLALAIPTCNNNDTSILPEIRRGVARPENQDILKELRKYVDVTISWQMAERLITYQSKEAVPILQEKGPSCSQTRL